MKYLHGHISPETAYVVNDYPYGFRLRCKMRYWIERTKKGERFCSQTTNPKRVDEVWNKPKKSTYCALMCMYQNNIEGHKEFGHIFYTGINKGWDDWSKVEPWLIKTGIDQADPFVAEIIQDVKIITHAQSVLTVTIRTSSGDPIIEAQHKKESEEAKTSAIRYGIVKTLREKQNESSTN